MVGHVTGISQCPGCKHQDETLEHVLCCQNILIRNRVKIVAKVMEEKIKKLKIPRQIAQCWVDIIMSQLDKAHKVQVLVGFSLKRAFVAQKVIDFNMMVRGYIVKEWSKLMDAHGTEDPDGKIAT